MIQNKMFELVFQGEKPDSSEALADIKAVFTNGNSSQSVKGFYDGNGTYKVRFLPREAGVYSWKVTGAVEAEGQEECTASTQHGMVHTQGCHFVYENGDSYIPFGTTVYALIHQDDALEKETLQTLQTSPFNKIRFCVFPKSYEFNENGPREFAFCKDAEGNWDVDHPNYKFWNHLEEVISQLQEMDIESDLILFHPYDRWGFSKLAPEQNETYLRYLVRRLSAFPGIWWSMANEYDLCFAKSKEEWYKIEEIIKEEDVYGHLLSNHYCMKPYDYSRENMTHCSLQNVLFHKADKLMRKYQKPIVFDEFCYEGDIHYSWGNISAQEMTHRFWCAYCIGAFATHGETYLSDDDVLWWAKGGKLKGKSPERIAFLRELMESLPSAIEPWYEPESVTFGDEFLGYKAGPDHPIISLVTSLTEPEDDAGALKDKIFSGRCGDQVYIKYLRKHCPRKPFFILPEDHKYKIDVIDTWNMTRKTIMTGASGITWLDLGEAKEGIALLAVEE